jgi:hypothetical protein
MTQIEALTQALFLAITAPTDKKADKAIKLAEKLSNGLTEYEVQLCKENALYLQYKAYKLEVEDI